MLQKLYLFYFSIMHKNNVLQLPETNNIEKHRWDMCSKFQITTNKNKMNSIKS